MVPGVHREPPGPHRLRLREPGRLATLGSEVLAEHPRGWPSDHAAVLSTVELLDSAPALKVMSYNVHYGVDMDDALDLLGLQEIGSKTMTEQLSRLTGMPVAFGPSKGNDDAYGDAILCRLPFEWVGNLALPSASSSRYQAMAVGVDVSSLYGPGESVRFVNTHFDWTDSIGSQESRRAAVGMIERGLCAGFSGPASLAGDLTTFPGSLPLMDLDARSWRPARAADGNAQRSASRPSDRLRLGSAAI